MKPEQAPALSRRPDGTSRFDVLAVLGVYGLAHALLLLCNGLYWDDWVVFGRPLAVMSDLYQRQGLPLFGYYHFALDQLGPAAYRLIVFLSYLASAFCAYAILGRVREIDRRTALLLVLFFAVFPSNSARISIMASRIAVCNALFFAGFWLLAVYLDTKALASRIAALALLFASFLTHSILVFYAVVPIYIAYHARSELGSWRSLRGLLLRHLDFLALPVAFWALKLAFFQPYGEFEGYNQVTQGSALHAFALIPQAFYGGFVLPIVRAFTLRPEFVAAAAIAAILLARLLAGIDSAPAPGTDRYSRWFLLAGIVFFVLGVYPYLAVGKLPYPNDWNSRHQLLTPLGAAFLLVFALRMVPGRRVQDLGFALLLGAFVAGSMQQWVAFLADWYKQVALVENFRASSKVRDGKYFLVNDRTGDLNANGRIYRFYEYSGLFHTAFGDERRLGQDMRYFPVYPFKWMRPFINARYHLGQYDMSVTSPDTAMFVDYGALKLTAANVMMLRALEFADEEKFRDVVKNAVRLSVASHISVAPLVPRR